MKTLYSFDDLEIKFDHKPFKCQDCGEIHAPDRYLVKILEWNQIGPDYMTPGNWKTYQVCENCVDEYLASPY